MKRKPLTRRQIAQLMKRQDGKCAVRGCDIALIVGPNGQHVNWVDEHIQPLSRGGDNALKNRQLRCIPHAKEKTCRPKSGGIGGDIFEARKTERMKKLRISKRQPHRRKKAKASYKWPTRKFACGQKFPTKKAVIL